MLNQSHLQAARQVLEGEMSHAELISTERSQHKFNSQHRAAAAMAILLVHADLCCQNEDGNQMLGKPGLRRTFQALLGTDASKSAVEASVMLGLHVARQGSRTVYLTPPDELLAITSAFSVSSPNIVAFMRDAKRLSAFEAVEWLPWHIEVDDAFGDGADALTAYGEKLTQPDFAIAVLAHLHATEATAVAEVIQGLPLSTKKAAIRRLLATLAE